MKVSRFGLLRFHVMSKFATQALLSDKRYVDDVLRDDIPFLQKGDNALYKLNIMVTLLASVNVFSVQILLCSRMEDYSNVELSSMHLAYGAADCHGHAALLLYQERFSNRSVPPHDL
ncbi:hypothetical protein NPIL_364411 [Nephila pilipes]|uniref:Uncharacterized protein n=1 Tax=Nephila pilipes TaxID=299642 RepID=A0A8X6UTV6_NEPPI|nr:hypothetical protein NPIL_364411 [Nephila pilipes]